MTDLELIKSLVLRSGVIPEDPSEMKDLIISNDQSQRIHGMNMLSEIETYLHDLKAFIQITYGERSEYMEGYKNATGFFLVNVSRINQINKVDNLNQGYWKKSFHQTRTLLKNMEAEIKIKNSKQVAENADRLIEEQKTIPMHEKESQSFLEKTLDHKTILNAFLVTLGLLLTCCTVGFYNMFNMGKNSGKDESLSERVAIEKKLQISDGTIIILRDSLSILKKKLDDSKAISDTTTKKQ